MPFTKRRALRPCAALALAAGLLAPLAPGTVAHADPAGETVRALAGKYRDAVVTLTVVVRASGMGAGEDSDAELNVPGFVVDPSGLVVTTDSAIDPASMMAGLMPDQAGAKFTTKVVSAKILTLGGDVIPAQVVLRDSDRNIAFIRPITAPTKPAAFIDLQTAGAAQIGDPVYCMSQLGKAGNRTLSISEYRLISVIEHPRTLYVPDATAITAAGNPAFNEQGAPLGLLSMRFSPMKSGGGSLFSRSDSYLPIVVPAADVAEEVKQALAAKAPAAAAPAKPATPAAPTKPAPGKKPHS